MLMNMHFSSLWPTGTRSDIEVSDTLGAGFLEKVYERALLRELALRDISAAAQASFAIAYKGRYVGEYFASRTSWWKRARR